jgi:hypothetical protein
MVSTTVSKRNNYSRISFIPFVFFIVASLILQGCSSHDDLSEGDQAPAFSLPSSQGEQISLSQVNDGQPVLLYFHMAMG